MPFIALNGILVLVPSAIFLNHRASNGDFSSMFHTVRGFDLGADALNLFLFGSSIHDGLKLAGTFCLGPLTADLPEIADKKRAAVPIDPYYVFGQNVDMAASVYSILLIVAVFFPVCKPWNNRGGR